MKHTLYCLNPNHPFNQFLLKNGFNSNILSQVSSILGGRSLITLKKYEQLYKEYDCTKHPERLPNILVQTIQYVIANQKQFAGDLFFQQFNHLEDASKPKTISDVEEIEKKVLQKITPVTDLFIKTTAPKTEQLKIQPTQTLYQYNPNYASYVEMANHLQQMINQGEIDSNTVHDLTNLIINEYCSFVDYLFRNDNTAKLYKRAYTKLKILNDAQMQQLQTIVAELGYDKNRKNEFYQRINKTANDKNIMSRIDFVTLVNAVMQKILNGRQINNIVMSDEAYNELHILNDHLPIFLLMGATTLKLNEGLLFKLGEKTIQTTIQEDDHNDQQNNENELDDEESIDRDLSIEVDSGGNDIVDVRGSHLTNPLTIDPVLSLSQQLQQLFSSIENKQLGLSRYNTKQYYSPKVIYETLFHTLHQYRSGDEMLQVLKSGVINENWCDEVVTRLESQPNLKTQFFTAMHLAQNKFVSILAHLSLTGEENANAQEKETNMYFNNTRSKKEEHEDRLYQIAISQRNDRYKQSRLLAYVASEKSFEKAIRLNVANVETIEGILTQIRELFSTNQKTFSPHLKKVDNNIYFWDRTENRYLTAAEVRTLFAQPLETLLSNLSNRSLTQPQKKLLSQIPTNGKTTQPSLLDLFNYLFQQMGLVENDEMGQRIAEDALLRWKKMPNSNQKTYVFASLYSGKTLYRDGLGYVVAHLLNTNANDSALRGMLKRSKSYNQLHNYLNKNYSTGFRTTFDIGGKSRQTYTPNNFLNEFIQNLHTMTKSEWKAFQVKYFGDVNTPYDEFHGVFADSAKYPWFTSLWKTIFQTVNQLFKNAGENDTLSEDIILKHLPTLFTFSDFNKYGWDEMVGDDYLLASLIGYFKIAKQTQQVSENMTPYLMPTMEAKGMSYYFNAPKLSTQQDQQNLTEVDRQRASLFMQELHRIRTTYQRAIYRLNHPEEAFNPEEDCSLQTRLNTNGTIETLQLIDFNRSLGTAKFAFLGTLQHLLPHINGINANANLTDVEKKLIYAMRNYIYGNQGIENNWESEEDDLHATNLQDVEDTFLLAAQVCHEDLTRQFNNWLKQRWQITITDANQIDVGDSQFLTQMFNVLRYENICEAKTKKYISEIKTLNEYEHTLSFFDAFSTDPNKQQTINEYQQQILKDFIQQLFDYFANHLNANEQLLAMLASDVAHYSDENQVQKRIAQFISTGLTYDTTTTTDSSTNAKHKNYQTMNVLTVQDFQQTPLTQFAPQEVYEFGLKLYETDCMTHINKVFPDTNSIAHQNAIKNLQKELSTMRKEWEKTNATDGQTIMSVPMLRKHLNMLGRSNDTINDILTKLENVYMCSDEERPHQIEIYMEALNNANWSIETQKTFTYGFSTFSKPIQESNGTVRNIQYQVGVQNKTADLQPINPQQLVQTGNQFMIKLQRFMIKNNIDEISFISAIKTGQKPALSLASNEYDSLDDMFNHLEQLVGYDEQNQPRTTRNQYVIELPVTAQRHTLETKPHFYDHRGTWGVQEQKLVCENVNPNDIFSLHSQPDGISGFELLQQMEMGFELKYRYAINQILRQISLTEDEKQNLTAVQQTYEQNLRLSKILTKQLENSTEYSFNTWWGLQLNEIGQFNVPLNSPTNFQLVSKLIFSLAKKTIINQTMPGGQLVQVANLFDLRDEYIQARDQNQNVSKFYNDALGFEVERNQQGEITNVTTLEVEVPLYNSAFQHYIDEKTGIVNNELLKKEHPELFEIIAYRIPTEGYCSMFKLTVKRFTNPKHGGNIVFPSAITTITGSDFDIDKVFFITPSFDRQGNYITPYTADEITSASLTDIVDLAKIENYLFERMAAVLSHKSTCGSRLKPGGFPTITKLGKIFNQINVEKQNHPERSTKEIYYDIQNGKIAIEGKRDIAQGRSVGNPGLQEEFHKRNVVGKQSVGVYANPRQVHAYLQHFSSQDIMESEKAMIRLVVRSNQIGATAIPVDHLVINDVDILQHVQTDTEGNQYVAYDTQYGLDQVTQISDVIRELLSAAVDATKNPILDDLNYNKWTVNLALSLIRLGFNFETATLFLKQPIVYDFCRRCANQMLYNTLQGNTYFDVLGFFEQTLPELYGVEAKQIDYLHQPINLTITTDSLLDGLDMSATDTQQRALLPLMHKMLRLSDDLKFLGQKTKVDSSSENTWIDMFSYIKYRVNQRLWEKRVENGQSELTSECLKIFQRASKGEHNYSRKLVTCAEGVHDVISQMIDLATPNFNLQAFEDIVVELSTQLQDKTFSDKQIRSLYYSWFAFQYYNRQGSHLQQYGFDYFLNEFPKIVATAQSYFHSQNQFSNLMGAQGLRFSAPNILKKKKTLQPYNTIGIYLKGVSELRKNNMKDEWATLLNMPDETIPGTATPGKHADLTYQQFGQLLIDYVIFKNGFSSTNNSFIQLVPQNAMDQYTDYKAFHENLSANVNLDTRNRFFELFLRQQQNWGCNLFLADNAVRQTTGLDVIPLDNIDFGSINSAPRYFVWKNMFYKFNMYQRQYERRCRLGAKELAVEYDESFIDEPNQLSKFNKFNAWYQFQEKREQEADMEQITMNTQKLKDDLIVLIQEIQSSGKQITANKIKTLIQKVFKPTTLQETRTANTMLTTIIASENLNTLEENLNQYDFLINDKLNDLVKEFKALRKTMCN